jgi:hypothetical protein
MKKGIFSLVALVGSVMFSSNANAIITYFNCPTLSPLPVTSFMPGAMAPILTAENAFEVGMNVTVMTSIQTSGTLQRQAISSGFVSLMQSMVSNNQTMVKQEMEIERQFSELKESYKANLQKTKIETQNQIFPSDTVFDPEVTPTLNDVNVASPTYKFVQQLCTSAKMTQMANSSVATKQNAIDINRRAQKIESSLVAVSSVNAVAKQNVDFHYDLFCSEDDFNNGLCEYESTAPNADISAFNFFYPAGYRTENALLTSDYATMYTYSPVESLASYQFIKTVSGNLFVSPPTQTDIKSSSKYAFVGAYKQAQAALNLASATLLELAQLREPLNNEGVIMSKLDVLNYQVMKGSEPDLTTSVRSASSSGKALELQKQMAVGTQLRLELLKLKEAQLKIKAGHLAIDSTLNMPVK